MTVGRQQAQKAPTPIGYTGNEGIDPTEEQIVEWMATSPELNIGLRVPPGVAGIDVDDYGGKPGLDTMTAASAKHGRLPRTWVSTSREGHSGIRFFRLPEQVLPGKIVHPDDPRKSGVDIIQHTHRYALVWPSIHPEGGEYRWKRPDGTTVEDGTIPQPTDFPVLPQPWIDHIHQVCSCFAAKWDYADSSADPVADSYRKWTACMTEEGGRHDAAVAGVMALVAFRLRGWPGADERLMQLRTDFLAALGDSRAPREAEAEWQRMVKGAERKAPSSSIPEWQSPAKPRDHKAAAHGGPAEARNLISVSSMKPEPVDWLWHPYIPCGGITLLDGDGDVGKSWISLAIAAKLSLQGDSTLFYSRENNHLPLRWATFESVPDKLWTPDSDDSFVLDSAGFALLEREIQQYGPRLVVIDPIIEYLPPGIDMYRPNEVRAIMRDLKKLAVKYQLAILLIRHLTKGDSTNASSRGQGSADFRNAARSALLAGINEATGERAFIQHKNNDAARGPAQGYTLIEGQGFRWTGDSLLSEQQLLGQNDKEAVDEAVDFLERMLDDGQWHLSSVVETLRLQENITVRNIKAARTRLRGRLENRRLPDAGREAPWQMRLLPAVQEKAA